MMLRKITFFILALLLVLPPFFDGGRNIFIVEIVLMLIAAAFLFLWLGKKNKRDELIKDLWSPPFIFLFLFLILSLVAVIFSTSPYDSFVEWIKYLGYGILFFVVVKSRIREREAEILIKTFLGISVILCLAGIYFYLTGGYTRLTSTFWWSNPFAGYLLFSIPLGFYWLFKNNKNLKEKLAPGLILVILLTAFTLTESRGAFLSLILILPFFVYFSAAQIKKNSISLLLVIVLSVFFVSGINFLKDGGSEIANRAKESFTSSDFSSRVRLDYWQGTWNIFKDYPVTGSGMSTFTNIYPYYQENVNSSGRYAHNLYLEMLSESGIFILALFIAFLFYIYWKKFKNLKEGGYVVSLYAGTLAFLIHNGVDMDWHFSANTLTFWIFLGLLWGQGYNSDTFKNKVFNILSKLNFRNKGVIDIVVSIVVVGIFVFLFVFSFISFYSKYVFSKGIEHQLGGNLALAKGCYKKSILLNPNPDYLRQYGIILYSSGISMDNEEGEGLLDKALKISQKSINLDGFNDLNYELQGRILKAQNKIADAEKDLRKAIELNKFKPRHYINFAELLIEQDRKDEARKLIESILVHYPEEMVEIRGMHIIKDQGSATNIEKEINYLKFLLNSINEK